MQPVQASDGHKKSDVAVGRLIYLTLTCHWLQGIHMIISDRSVTGCFIYNQFIFSSPVYLGDEIPSPEKTPLIFDF
jgi:hypothetical protein